MSRERIDRRTTAERLSSRQAEKARRNGEHPRRPTREEFPEDQRGDAWEPPPEDDATASGRPPQPETWDDPIPLESVGPLPAFPLAELPDWQFRWVKETSHATQTPPDLAGMLSLANIGAALATKFRVLVRRGWSEPMNIFVCSVLNVGERKSEVFRRSMAPTRAFEEKLKEESAAARAAAQADHGVLESRVKSLTGRAAKEADANARNKLREELKEAAREVARHMVPPEPQLVADDVSMEELSRLIAVHKERMLVASPEGTIFEILKGRYSKDAILDVFLKGHAGDYMRTNRLSRQQPDAKNPALSTALAVQPDVVVGIGKDATMKKRGILARFWYCVPASLLGRRLTAAEAVSEETEDAYYEALMALWATIPQMEENGKESPHLLRFSEEAGLELQAFERWLEPQLAPGEELSVLAGWANKLAGAIARLTGILHMAQAWNGEVIRFSRTIDVKTVKAAIRFGRDYLLPHAKASFGLMATDDKVDDAKRVIRWLGNSLNSLNCLNGVQVVKQSDIHARILGSRYRVEDVEVVVELLVKRGYLRPVNEERRPGPGRKPSARFHVHPSVLTSTSCSENSDNSENCREPGEEG